MALSPAPLADVAHRLAALLRGEADHALVSDGDGTGDLVIDGDLIPRPLAVAAAPPPAVWAIDGGQALVRDARCLQVYVVRSGRCRYEGRVCTLEECGDLRAHLVGVGQRAAELARLDGGLGLGVDCALDVNLLRERAEWDALERTLAEAEPGDLVLVDGDLRPDPRIPPAWFAGLLEAAHERGVLVVGVTKHTSLARGNAPLLGQLERDADASLGLRTRWWAPVGRSAGRRGALFTVVAAKLDPDAPFSFRVDIAAGTDPETALAALATVCDDAGFPGYPYPLTVADRLAACPPWVREEAWFTIEDQLARAGVPLDVRDRAFTDRHRLMERAS